MKKSCAKFIFLSHFATMAIDSANPGSKWKGFALTISTKCRIILYKITYCNLLTKDKIVDLSKLKAFADHKLKMTKKTEIQ